MKKYQLYGIVVETEQLFPIPLIEADRQAKVDIRFKKVAVPVWADWGAWPIVYDSKQRESIRVRIYQSGERLVASIGKQLSYFMHGDQIDCLVTGDLFVEQLLLTFLGPILAIWLEWHRVLALHMAAVVMNGVGVGFLANNKSGKSSLAVSLMMGGHQLLTDDILAVRRSGAHFFGAAGYPQVRLWVEQARYFFQRDDLPLVHPAYDKRWGPVEADQFCIEERPLGVIYIPEWVSGDRLKEVEITPLSFGEAFQLIMKNSFVSNSVKGLGWEGRRFPLVTELIKAVPVRRLRYPAGYDQLGVVEKRILANLRSDRDE